MNKIYHLTPEGLQRYKEEYQRLKHSLRESKTKMRETRDEIWKPDDLNPDYQPLESEMMATEKRLKEIENILRSSATIRPRKNYPKEVSIGSKVVAGVNGTTEEFVIVETIESNPTNGMVSKESPIGKELLGKKTGDTVTLKSPVKVTYKIKRITFYRTK
jgi:transcription elongation factor GreA